MTQAQSLTLPLCMNESVSLQLEEVAVGFVGLEVGLDVGDLVGGGFVGLEVGFEVG